VVYLTLTLYPTSIEGVISFDDVTTAKYLENVIPQEFFADLILANSPAL